jgi:hypothetical protein
MPEYNVSWTIDSVTADSPEEAAQWCRDTLLDPTNIASFFHVTDEDGNDFEIDTLVPAADKPDSVKSSPTMADRWASVRAEEARIADAKLDYPESNVYTGGRSADEYTMSVLAMEATEGDATATCKHCGRSITRENDTWVDTNATGDDAVWRETCDSHDTFTAEHEPDEEEGT